MEELNELNNVEEEFDDYEVDYHNYVKNNLIDKFGSIDYITNDMIENEVTNVDLLINNIKEYYSTDSYEKSTKLYNKIGDEDKINNYNKVIYYMEIEEVFYKLIADHMKNEPFDDNSDTLTEIVCADNLKIYNIIKKLVNHYLKDYLKDDNELDAVKNTIQTIFVSYDNNKSFFSNISDTMPYIRNIYKSAHKKGVDRVLNSHEIIGNMFNVSAIIASKEADTNIIAFAELKYDELKSLEEIQQIMNIDKATAENYYLITLNYIREIIKPLERDTKQFKK